MLCWRRARAVPVRLPRRRDRLGGAELRQIASALLGSVDMVADPAISPPTSPR